MSMVPEGTPINLTLGAELPSAQLYKTLDALRRQGMVSDFSFVVASKPEFRFDEDGSRYFGMENIRHYGITHDDVGLTLAEMSWRALSNAYMNFRGLSMHTQDWHDSGLVAMVDKEWDNEHQQDHHGLDENLFISLDSLGRAIETGALGKIYNVSKSRIRVLSGFLIENREDTS